ncbi:MAG: TetR/AcrR family transcriptional regulator [Acidobacteriota bacterium]
MRGRPREFDRDEALDRALDVFWDKGYGAAAIGDLTRAMGIGRQSLYDTFGDKHSLYLEALRRYAERRLVQARETFEAEGTPLENLRVFFAEWREEALDGTCGCMMVNSSTEVGAVDEAAARIVENTMRRLEDLLAELLERARTAGELTDLASPRALARLIVDAANGMSARSRMGLSADEVDDVLGALDAMLTVKARPAA